VKGDVLSVAMPERIAASGVFSEQEVPAIPREFAIKDEGEQAFELLPRDF